MFECQLPGALLKDPRPQGIMGNIRVKRAFLFAVSCSWGVSWRGLTRSPLAGTLSHVTEPPEHTQTWLGAGDV